MLFENQNSEHHGETTCLGKQNNDHQKAFTALLGAHSRICTGSYMISFVVLCHARYHYVTSYCDIIPDIIEVYHTQISCVMLCCDIYTDIIYDMRQAACFITSTTHHPNVPTASRRRTIPGSPCLILTPHHSSDATSTRCFSWCWTASQLGGA